MCLLNLFQRSQHLPSLLQIRRKKSNTHTHTHTLISLAVFQMHGLRMDYKLHRRNLLLSFSKTKLLIIISQPMSDNCLKTNQSTPTLLHITVVPPTCLLPYLWSRCLIMCLPVRSVVKLVCPDCIFQCLRILPCLAAQQHNHKERKKQRKEHY